MIKDIKRYFDRLVDQAAAERRGAMEKAVSAGEMLMANGHLERARGLEHAKDLLKQAITDFDTDDSDDDDDEDTQTHGKKD